MIAKFQALFLLLIAALSSENATATDVEGTANYFDKNSREYVGKLVTVYIEEGASIIPQDEKNPIDVTRAFLSVHTVDPELHKNGGIIYAGFPKEEIDEARDMFNSFPDRVRPLTGILRKTPLRGNLYLETSIKHQNVGNSKNLLSDGPTAKANEAKDEISDEIKSKVIASTVVIRTDKGGGSGFIVEESGQKYIITNQHVILGAAKDKIEIKATSGQKLQPISLQIVADQDLARIAINDGPDPLVYASDAIVDETVATVGNSLDAGVITFNKGLVKGVSSSEVEVDCEVVPGQSGGPLINKDGSVIGATTYILFADSSKVAENTRYAKKRYFVVRVNQNTQWMPVQSWHDYTRIGEKIYASENVIDLTIDIAISTDNGPDEKIVYDGLNRNIRDAVQNHNRFSEKMEKMRGDVVTSSELERNNASLGANFRSVFRALMNACKEQEQALDREMNLGKVRQYPWLLKRTEETKALAQDIYILLETRSKARPKFLTW